jgi:two-component system KDP operon response regulator KdpE
LQFAFRAQAAIQNMEMAGPLHTEQQTNEAMSIQPDKILIVAEDASFCISLRKTLEEFEFDCGEASNGDTALMRLRMVDYDAILLDLPETGLIDIATCRQVRRVYPRIPLLVVSGCACMDKKVEALESGADDYIIKPFSTREIAARLRSAIRRFHAPTAGTAERVAVGEIVLDPAKRRIEKSGAEVSLTPLEFRTLQLLMEQAGRPVDYITLLSTLWGQDSRQHRYHLRVLIGALRKKIEDDPAHPTYLITYNYFGYCFREQ